MLYWENTLIHLHTISSFVIYLDLIVKVVAEAACSSFRQIKCAALLSREVVVVE